MNKLITIEESLVGIDRYFTPRIIGEVNDVYVKLAKIKGQDVPWHSHDGEDELFYILDGSLVLKQKNCDDINMAKGDMYIVEKGIIHRVYSSVECSIMLIENKESKHTGDVASSITKSIDDQQY